VRPRDLLTMPLESLWRRKTRTVLTTLGVVFGAFVLAASLSIGQGVQDTIDRESHRDDFARRVYVSPKWKSPGPLPDDAGPKVDGEMSAGRRERLREALAAMTQWSNPDENLVTLSRERLSRLGSIPHVDRMVPLVNNFGFLFLGERSHRAGVNSARPDDEALRRRIVAGRFFDAPDEPAVVLSELLAYLLGITDEADVEGLVGKTIRIEFRSDGEAAGFGLYLFKPSGTVSRDEAAALDKVKGRLPGALEKLGLSPAEAQVLRDALGERPSVEPHVQTLEFPIVGVIRRPTSEEQKGPWDPLRVDADVLMPFQTAGDVFFETADRSEQGASQAVLFVDSERNVREVVKQAEALGLESRSAIEFIERERLIYLLIFGGMTCVAAVALLVAALGIANTMLMSVLERTREIGVMKAVGADDRHLLFMFLVEGALIGLVGAGLGLLLAWGASHPADAWIQSMVLNDMKLELTEGIFVFPTWLIATVLIVPIVVTTLAALYPARRAARIDPVAALRHE